MYNKSSPRTFKETYEIIKNSEYIFSEIVESEKNNKSETCLEMKQRAS